MMMMPQLMEEVDRAEITGASQKHTFTERPTGTSNRPTGTHHQALNPLPAHTKKFPNLLPNLNGPVLVYFTRARDIAGSGPHCKSSWWPNPP